MPSEEDYLGLYLSKVRKLHCRIDEDEEKRLIEKFICGCTESRDAIVYSVLPMVISMAKKYRGRGVDYEDLIQAGNVGAMIALKKFDPVQNVRYSSYAAWWIRNEICRQVEKLNCPGIRLPSSVHMLPGDKREEIDLFRESIVSLSECDDIDSLLLVKASKKQDQPPFLCIRREAIILVRNAIGKLSDVQKDIVLKRLHGKTHDEISRDHGVSKSRIGQLDRAAIRRIAIMFGIEFVGDRVYES